MTDQPPQQNIPLQANPEVLKGVYANNMQVAHTKEEFYLDFLNMSFFPNAATLVAKVITSPEHFKRIVAALTDNLSKYEEKYGIIDSPKPETSQAASESSKFGF
ncbi:MAG: DUF3467 domain-containing protein [Candidatus Doudnabacteria bacterium]|nr:DUF3467 domain-containing protein [Candidatus Doudnabacteria bacterium]